jgi:hypothetical protein
MLLLVLLPWPATCADLLCREMEELTFFDGPKPEWTKERSPGYGRLDFLRPGELLQADMTEYMPQQCKLFSMTNRKLFSARPCTGRGLWPCCQLHRPVLLHCKPVCQWTHERVCVSGAPVSRLACSYSGCVLAGGGFGGPIRSRLVGDGSLPDEPPVVLAPQRGPPPPGTGGGDPLARSSSWRPGAEGSTPPDRWNGTATLVSSSSSTSSSCPFTARV